MCQKDFFAAISGESELLHNLGLLGLGNHRTVKVGAFSVTVALQLLETSLVVKPFIGQKFSTIHASDGNNHFAYYRLRFGSRQICRLLSRALHTG